MTALVVDLAAQRKRFEEAARRFDAVAPRLGLGPNACRLEDFVAYMPTHNYIFKPTRELWPALSVNAQVPPVDDGTGGLIPASKWLAKHRAVVQMTWAPGYPMEIKDRLISEGGWIDRPGCTVFNLYRPPNIEPRRGPVDPWLDHVRRIFGDDSEHILNWLAHRVQRPHEKINHALVLGGPQGIGKDTMLEPIKRAIGPWNFIEVNPKQMLMRFNSFLKSVILRVNEARDLGEFDRFAFYDHMKAYTAAPPDVLRIDEKHLREYSVVNVCGVVITTNYKTDGIYLPADDRRHFVAWSERTKEEFTPDYWNSLYGWYNNGGTEHVTAYLRELDLSAFKTSRELAEKKLASLYAGIVRVQSVGGVAKPTDPVGAVVMRLARRAIQKEKASNIAAAPKDQRLALINRLAAEYAQSHDVALRPRAEKIVALENVEVEPLPVKKAEPVPTKKGKKAA